MAHPVLLQKKYARIVNSFAKEEKINLNQALDIFYHSNLYNLMREGVSDIHCMSDGYLVDELLTEIKSPQKLKQ
ncbi:MAG: DUF3791 domain-containing protein [Selenomonadaceae bacterium]|nr:DUF3791 domain-containing protein [Selenomonadaceae bacterium]MBP3723153.1 DUF3791 domain-containing protein [Selenomonadaceae bacterium]